jgi:hypothetical protein
MLLSELALVRAAGTAVAVVEPDAGDLRAMGSLAGCDVLDEGLCPAIVERVRASVSSRVASGAVPALRPLLSPARVAA